MSKNLFRLVAAPFMIAVALLAPPASACGSTSDATYDQTSNFTLSNIAVPVPATCSDPATDILGLSATFAYQAAMVVFGSTSAPATCAFSPASTGVALTEVTRTFHAKWTNRSPGTPVNETVVTIEHIRITGPAATTSTVITFADGKTAQIGLATSGAQGAHTTYSWSFDPTASVTLDTGGTRAPIFGARWLVEGDTTTQGKLGAIDVRIRDTTTVVGC